MLANWCLEIGGSLRAENLCGSHVEHLDFDELERNRWTTGSDKAVGVKHLQSADSVWKTRATMKIV